MPDYYIPELCVLNGLDDSEAKNGKLMQKLSKETKLSPDERVKKTNEFLLLLNETERKKDKNGNPIPNLKSPKELSEEYVIQIKPVTKMFKAYYMEEPTLIDGEGNPITKNKPYKFYEGKDFMNWVFIYAKDNRPESYILEENLKKSAKEYGINLSKGQWIEVDKKAKVQEWINTAEEYMNKNENFFIIFLIDNDDDLYNKLKKNSLRKNGYISQIVKKKSLIGKVFSKVANILTQINSKLQGISYIARMDKSILTKKIMAIGVDSNKMKGKKRVPSMVSSTNESFTNFYHEEKIVEEEKKDQIAFYVGSFIQNAKLNIKKSMVKCP